MRWARAIAGDELVAKVFFGLCKPVRRQFLLKEFPFRVMFILAGNPDVTANDPAVPLDERGERPAQFDRPGERQTQKVTTMIVPKGKVKSA